MSPKRSREHRHSVSSILFCDAMNQIGILRDDPIFKKNLVCVLQWLKANQHGWITKSSNSEQESTAG